MHVEGIGEVRPWGEYWLLEYDACGHETYLSRTGHRLFERTDVEAEIRQHYAECTQCPSKPRETML